MNKNDPMGDALAPSILARPMDRSLAGSEIASLNALVTMMNNPEITGAVVPKGEETKAPVAHLPAPHPTSTAAAAAALAEPPAPAPTRGSSTQIFFTGKLKVGKDHAAKAVSAEIFGFADPIYELASLLTGLEISSSKGKDIPGVRTLLQAIGQWGRNEINAQYPITPARILFVRMIQDNFPCGKEFGTNKDIWIDALLRRWSAWSNMVDNTGKRAAITNVRFLNEFKTLSAAGWTGWHVMCSPTTWAKRLEAAKLTPQSPAVLDMSEALAVSLDANVIKQISAQKNGPMLRCIWNDEFVKPPSARLHTLNSFLQTLAISEVPALPDDSNILTGE